EGGMGAVYRATDTRLHRDVAIKVLTAITMSDHERISRFEQEARTIGMLNHPNLLTIFDVGNAGPTPFLVSELLEGETLRERLDRGAIPPRKTIEYSSQIASGLAAAHEKGVVHRDLKPENIFLTKEGRVKILDFGIAKLSPMRGADGPTFQMAATEPGMVLGTVGYMSPEQVRGEPVDQRSDIFAFGAIIYEMLTGQRAFKRPSSIETLSAILKEEPPDITDSHPNVPAPLEKLVRRCLEKDRDHRVQTARDLAFNLETFSTFSNPGTLSNTRTPMLPTGATAATGVGVAQTSATGTLAPTGTMRGPSMPSRTRTMAAVKSRRVSPVLLAVLYLVSVVGAAIGAWYFANRTKEKPPEVSFRRMTFRRGDVHAARFSIDGETIVYSAAWDGQPSEIYVASRRSPEARPVGIPDSEILAIAKTTELAVLLHRDRLTNLGTLARVPLAGGMPREVANDVLQADWSPDGSTLAIIRFANEKFRIEYPIGNVRYETVHGIRDIRLSPDGNRIAFIEQYGGQSDIAIIEKKAPVAIARGWGRGATGLAWSQNGQEIWITGTDTGAPPSLYAVAMNGDIRLVSRLTGSVKLFDISPTGSVLLSNGMWRAALQYQPPGETAERDVSWLDWSVLADLSGDGKTILFNETREGGGTKSGVYLRKLDASTPIRIGDGYGDGLSPDGKYALTHVGGKLVLRPTAAGEARELKIVGGFDLGAAWFPDNHRVVIGGALPNKGYQLHVIDILDETVTPITPENIWSNSIRPFAISPDGRTVAGMTQEETIALYPANGGTATALPSTQKGEVPIAWSANGTLLYVYRPTSLPAQVYRVNVATGAREMWRQFSPADPAGVYKISPVLITPDGGAYAYNALRTLSDLYIGEGLR
ncbi:MAG: protein kinase domain-containing protein, partial [Thermoanaerobaculia bacterium]